MKKIFSMLGIAAGIVIIISGIVILNMEVGTTYLESTSFGADFYTYSYRATRIAAENVGYLARIISKGIGFLLIAIGATNICVFGCKLADSKNPNNLESNVLISVKKADENVKG